MIKQQRAYKYETHLHTGETSKCGKIKGSEVARAYKIAGYEGIIVTDHYNKDYFQRRGARTLASGKRVTWIEKVDKFLSGYRGALEEGKRIGLKVLLGMEIRFDDSNNDYLVYGFDESFLRDYPDLYNLDLQSFREFLEEKIGRGRFLIYQAHPYRAGITPADPLYLDGVEVFNGNPRHNSRNDLALRFAEENGLKKISGSDFHRRGDLARGGIILPAKVTSIQELIKMLKEDQKVGLVKTPGAPLSFMRLVAGFADLFRQ